MIQAQSWRQTTPLSLASKARDTLQAPKVYCQDTGLVLVNEGLRFENLVACHLLKNVHGPQAQAIQLLRDCPVEADIGRLQERDAAPWLASLPV